MWSNGEARGPILAGFLVVFGVVTAGCIAVSREITRETVTSPAGAAVTGGGHSEIEQEWVCREVPRFDLERERAAFDGSCADWLAEGWELADFDVVSLPGTGGEPSQTCLVGTFRRWVPAEG